MLTKSDLAREDVAACVREIAQIADGRAEVIAISAIAGDGMDRVREYARPGRTLAFIGSSGEGIIGDGRTAHSGVYVMLQKRDQDCFTGGQQRIEVAYLLTDGPRANDIGEGGAIILPPMLDAKETRILMPTFGGTDEMTDESSLDLTAKYYHLSKDRIITKADVKNFCIKELVCFYRLRSDQIKGIDVTRDDEASSQTMVVTVTIEPNPNQEIPDDQLKRMASELAQKINLHTTGFCSYTVVIKELDVC